MPLMSTLGALKQLFVGASIEPATTYFLDQTLDKESSGTNSVANSDYDPDTNRLTLNVSNDGLVDIDVTTNQVTNQVVVNTSTQDIYTIKSKTIGGISQKSIIFGTTLLTISSTNVAGTNQYYANPISGPTYLNSVAVDSSGNRYVVGGYMGFIAPTSNPSSDQFCYIAKFDDNNTLIWQKEFNLTDGPYSHIGGFTDIKIDASDDLYVIGNYANSNNSLFGGRAQTYGLVLKLDSSGSLIWQNKFDLNTFYPERLTITNNYLYATGYGPDVLALPTICYVCKMSLSTGSVVSTITFDDFYPAGSNSVTLAIDSDLNDVDNKIYLTFFQTTASSLLTPNPYPTSVICLDESFTILFSNTFAYAIGGTSNPTFNYPARIINDYATGAMYITSFPFPGNIKHRSAFSKLPNDGSIPTTSPYTLSLSQGEAAYVTYTPTVTTPTLNNSVTTGTMDTVTYTVSTSVVAVTPTSYATIKTNIG